MIGEPAAMLVERALHLDSVEETGARCAGGIPRLESEIAEAACEPVRERHLEAKLGASARPRRQPRFDRLSQYVFSDAAAQLEIGRHGQSPVDEMMREERNARFERMCHACTIEPLQQRGRHVNGEIAEHELLHRGEMLRDMVGECPLGAELKGRTGLVAQPEVAIVDARADRRGRDRDSGEETFEAVGEQGSVAESNRMVAEIIELP